MKTPNTLDIARLRRKLRDEVGKLGKSDQPLDHDGPKLSPHASQVAQHLREASRSPIIILGQLGFFEFCCMLAIGFAVYWFVVQNPAMSFVLHAGFAALAAATYALLLLLADGYQIQILRQPSKSLKRALITWAFALSVMALSCLLFPDSGDLYRWLIGWGVVGSLFIAIERYLLALGIRRWTRNGLIERRAVIVGGGDPAKVLIRRLESQEDSDIRICGIFDDRQGKRSPTMVAGYPKLGTVPELVQFAREARIDVLIISLPLSAEARILQLLKMLWVLPVDIRLAAHSDSLMFRPRAYSHVGDVAMLDLVDKPIRDWDSVAKRAFDIVFSLIALAILWPVMLAAAIAVRATSKGPILFVQKRHGFNNEIVNVMKFRSMYTEMSDPSAKLAVTRNDPRVTPVGRFLRKSSLDELPQLFNVLRGELSLVGPRPHAILAQTRDRLYGDIVEGYFARHRVKPGVTGWAQVNGWRGEIDTDDKIKGRTACDLYYIENWSLLLDLKILFMTPFSLLNMENAY
ncbi:undecaprenyl-phosphate glucose phosphotransferase [Rhizobium sp.]|jgi:Undecaprenyl-phosphate glucose phosphotransferase|uniref:undecaprenyl-phosphate glucose phosphotransferase n=1 Tax=Rhizobium sp. TaxID=391 RepID=UPI000E9D0C5A|nr:undecaprenyl-phosphate glucose phosphotransferase [Rhizobium sp.]